MSETNINGGHRRLDEDFELLKDHDIDEEIVVEIFSFYGIGDAYINLQLSMNVSTPGGILDELSNINQRTLLDKIAVHPNTKIMTLLSISARYPGEFCAMAAEESLENRDTKEWRSLVQSCDSPLEIFIPGCNLRLGEYLESRGLTNCMGRLTAAVLVKRSESLPKAGTLLSRAPSAL